MKLLSPREPGQRLVGKNRKREKLATIALQAPGDSLDISSQVEVKPQKGIPDSHCQLLTAPEGVEKLMNALLSLRIREREEVVTDMLMCQRQGKGMNGNTWPLPLLQSSPWTGCYFYPFSCRQLECCCGYEVDSTFLLGLKALSLEVQASQSYGTMGTGTVHFSLVRNSGKGCSSLLHVFIFQIF